jgi:hypothetical protein
VICGCEYFPEGRNTMLALPFSAVDSDGRTELPDSRTVHHDLGVALDRCCGEHAGAGGKSTGVN